MEATQKALVLKVGRMREVDMWLRLLTPGNGVFTAFAFGGCRSRKRFCGCLDFLNHALFTFGSSRSGQYISLEEGSLLHGFQDLKKDPARMGMAANCLKFVESLEPGREDGEPLYNILLETLQMLEDTGMDGDILPFLFRAKCAFELGYEPDFMACGQCGEQLSAMDSPRFSVQSGHVICAACKSQVNAVDGHARPVARGTLLALAWLQRSRPAQWPEMVLAPEVGRQLRRVAETFVAYHLGLQWENGVYKKV